MATEVLADSASAQHDPLPLAHSIEGAARRLGLGRTKLFALIRNKQLPAVKCGKRTLVPCSS